MACSHNCKSCQSATCGKNQSLLIETNEKNHIKNIIGVLSGKGGVGKSMVTSLLACNLAAAGYKVGILDSDITGPSIPKAFGQKDGIVGEENLMYPSISKKYGIKVMSINLLLDSPDKPVVWRGALLGSAIKQFYQDVLWGELDYLLIDMPPGTGDVALNVFQMIPVDGVLIVSTPQDLVKMIVGKALYMCKEMNIKVLGLIENMAYYKCPCCGNPLYPFGPSKLLDVANTYNIKPISSLPIDPNIASKIDAGEVENLDPSILDEIRAVLE